VRAGLRTRTGLRVADQFRRQLELFGVAAFLVAFWAGFIFGALAIVGAVWP
jgi:hypothetical protein